jgi:teichuronic acid biosynthesis glycosyltransferase TuaG
MTELKASVVIPVYNASRWAVSLHRCLSDNAESVAEVILINDGDPDDFQKLAGSLETAFGAMIRIAATAGRQGPAVGRNLGLQLAAGRYVAFLDCDDVWLAGSLRARLEVLVDDPQACFSYCSGRFIEEGGRRRQDYRVPRRAELANLLVTNFVFTSSLVLDRNRAGPRRFPICGHEDYAFLLDLVSTPPAYGIGVRTVGMEYRIGSSSLSADKHRARKWHYEILRQARFPFVLLQALYAGYAVNGVLKKRIGFGWPVFLGLPWMIRRWVGGHVQGAWAPDKLAGYQASLHGA